MLKIDYPIYCGMDVHKSFLIACIASTNNQGVTTYTSKRFSTFTKDLRLCATWLSEHNVYTSRREPSARCLRAALPQFESQLAEHESHFDIRITE